MSTFVKPGDHKNILFANTVEPRGGGALPYLGYRGMCGPKGNGFLVVLVINRVLILVILPPFWS